MSNIIDILIKIFTYFIFEVNFIISKVATILDFLGHYKELKYRVVTSSPR